MIHARLPDTQLSAAVLAGKLIARKQVELGQRRPALTKLDITEQPDDSWNLNYDRNRTYLALVNIDNLNFAKEREPQSALPGNNPQRLEARI